MNSNESCGPRVDDDEWHSARSRRKRALEVIQSEETPLTLPDLASAVVDWERTRGLRTSDVPDETSVRIRLHHVDLPKLHDREVIEYDASRRIVSRRTG